MMVSARGYFLMVPTALLAVLLLVYIGHQTKISAEALELYSVSEPLDAALVRLDKQALEDAYRAKLVKLFEVRLRQPTIDERAFKAGVENARRFYRQAAAQIAAREQQLREK